MATLPLSTTLYSNSRVLAPSHSSSNLAHFHFHLHASPEWRRVAVLATSAEPGKPYSTQTGKSESVPPKKPVYSLKKKQIVRVDKEKYLNSVNYLSVGHPPYYKGLDYIYEDRGEETLRNCIISKVEQSVALNTPGAENKEPRELFDAIHDEIENPVLDLISEAVWQVMESQDGLGKEINETVESVYYQLSHGRSNAPPGISLSDGQQFVDQEPRKPPSFSSSSRGKSIDIEPTEPPGFSHFGGRRLVDRESQQPVGFSLHGSREFADRKSREPPGLCVSGGHQFVDGKPPIFGQTALDVEPREPPGFSRPNAIGGEQRGSAADGRVSPYIYNSNSRHGRRGKRQRYLRGSRGRIHRAYKH